MAELGGVLVRQRRRVNEIAAVLHRYGFVQLAAQARSASAGGRSRAAGADTSDTADGPTGMSTGERLRGALTDLGTTGIKFGQMLSLRGDLVGDGIAAELAALQTDVPADPAGTVERTVERSLAMPLAQAYADFDPVPMASASVAQVHRARLHDGTVVAVKVIHDGAGDRVRSDLELMAALAAYLETIGSALAEFGPTLLVAEFATMMRAAIDLRAELANLQRFTRNFADEPDVIIPAVYPERSAGDVLTMQLMTGTPFESRARLEADGWDVERLVRRATDIYLEMIFRDGVYHADPHPGNFLLPDSEHIIILDFGDVGYLATDRRRQVEDLVSALSEKKSEDVADALIELTDPPAAADLGGLHNDVDQWMTRYLEGRVADVDLGGMVGSGTRLLRQHGLRLPPDTELLLRVLVQLQGMGRQVDTVVSMEEVLQPYVQRMVERRLDPSRWIARAGRTAKSWDRLLSSLPDQLGHVLTTLEADGVSVDITVRDPDGAVPQLVDGLIASSSIIGASLLLSQRTPPMVRGISVLGILAATLGVGTWRRLQMSRADYEPLATRTLRTIRATLG